MRIRRIVHAGGLLTALALASGCGAQYDEEVTGLPNNGDLRVEYTIDGTKDEDRCAAIGADRMRLIVFVDGGEYARARVPCENFAVSIDMPADVYDLRAELIDENEQPVSRTVEIGSVLLEPGGSVYQIDFESMVTIDTPEE